MMTRKALGLALCLLSLSLSWSAPLWASSLPKADLDRHTISLGTAPSLSGEFVVNSKWGLGLSAATPFFYGDFGFVRYSLDTSYQIFRNDNLYLRGIVGVFGDLDPLQRSGLSLSPFGIQGGIGLAYGFSPEWTGRLNFVAGIAFPKSTGWGLFPPAGGIELAYHPVNHYEVSIGFNGNGDILALRYLF